jgi:hypothetical protein
MTSSSPPAGNQPRAIYFGPRLIVRILPDPTHPNIWRLRWSDGRLSDLTNLARAMDAALALAALEPGADRRRLRREMEQPDGPSKPRRRTGAGRRHL